MKVMLQSAEYPDVGVRTAPPGTDVAGWEICGEERLEQHIRTLNVALKWLRDEKVRKENKAAGPK